MKKLLSILLCLPLIVFGQEKSFELGLLFGGSLNSLNGDPEFTKETIQPIGGVLAQYNFTKPFSVKSKLLYHIKGGRTTTFIDNTGAIFGEYDHRLDFHYVTLPLLAQFNFGKNKWRVFCNTGVYLGALMKAEDVYKEAEGAYEGRVEKQPLENFNKFDFGAVLGCGTSFQINERTRIFVESSWGHGLTNTPKAELMDNDIMLTEAMTAALGLTYSFSTKKKAFNGTSTLDCADYDESSMLKQKRKSKWRLVLYKDGEKVGRKPKKGKSRLFKKKD
jgi:hypothetical protein